MASAARLSTLTCGLASNHLRNHCAVRVGPGVSPMPRVENTIMTRPTLSDAIRVLEERLLEPEVRCSPIELDRLLAKGFVEFASDGNQYDKEQVIAALQHEHVFRRSIGDFDVVAVSQDVVLATYEVTRENVKSGAVVASLRSSIWKRNGEDWQLVFHQGTIRGGPSVPSRSAKESQNTKPFVFASVQEFRAHLSASETKQRVRQFFSQRCQSVPGVVRVSVGGSAFRAFPFQRLDLKTADNRALIPSALYRKWATPWLRSGLPELRAIQSHEEMGRFVATAAQKLDKHWTRETKGRHNLGFGRAAKMLNLTIKYAMWLDAFTEDERNRLIPYLHVPLDRFTLRGVIQLLPGLKIPATALMGFVTERRQYERIQNEILELCNPDFYPIEYEFVVWNLTHPDIDPVQQAKECRCVAA